MTRVEELQEIECLTAAYLTEDDAVWPMAEGSFQEVTDANAGKPFCGCRASKRTRLSWSI